MDSPEPNPSRNQEPHPLREVVLLFLRLGLTAFGGPAAHISIMHDEVVKRRKWLTDQEFLDLLGATNLIPGPNSTEMAIHFGYLRAGWKGLILAGLAFTLPATIIVTGFAWIYVTYAQLPQAGWLLNGIQPVVIVIIVQALWLLGKKAVRGIPAGVILALIFALYLVGFNPLLLLFGCGFGFLAWAYIKAGPGKNITPTALLVFALLSQMNILKNSLPSLWELFLNFLKIGVTLYGSGYVLIAFLQNDFVSRSGWLTEQQLLDAVAIGQITPGPLFTTATFIGYLLAGIPGAIVSTLGIFLPSFVFVAISSPFIPRLRQSPLMAGFLDGVNIAALALMAGVSLELSRSMIGNPVSIIIALMASVLLFRFRVSSTWLIFGGAGIGFLAGLFSNLFLLP